MKSLYDLTAELLSLLDVVDDGALTDDDLQALDEIQGDRTEKIRRTCEVLAVLRVEQAAAANEARRLQTLAQRRARAIDLIEDRIQFSMEALGEFRISAGNWKVRIQKNSVPSVVTKIPAAELPEEFQRITVEPDKAAILTAWKEDRALPEGIEVSVGTHLRIS